MAQLIAIGGWTAPGSVAAYLRETLPDDYVVVADPVIARTAIPCIILGRTCLFVVHAVEEENAPAELSSAGVYEGGHVADASGDGARLGARALPQDAAAGRARAEDALRLFLEDEFPRLDVQVRHVDALRDWIADLPTWRVIATAVQRDDLLTDVIQAQDVGDVALPAETRREIGAAMRDREFTASQRALKPFVFRSGSALHTGRPVWTLSDAVAHMDRYPSDGIHHLRNGTLAEWLDEEGAAHLAHLARSVISHPGIDMHVALETFLFGTGLVERPALTVRPRQLDLGYAVEGHPLSATLQLVKGKGRGYLTGTLGTSDPWLQVAPTTFKGNHSEVIVSAETSGLRIRPNPIYTSIIVKCSASEAPIVVPVVLRVMAQPSHISRGILRPAIGMLTALPVGALLGWLCALAGLHVPFAAATSVPVLLVAALWALAGLWLGTRQPAAWPVFYALRRWLRRDATWLLILGGTSGILVWSWTQGLGAGFGWSRSTALQAALIGAALSFLPMVHNEMAHNRLAADPRYVMGRHSTRRLAVVATTVAAVLTLALLAPAALAPLLKHVQVGPVVASAESSMKDGLGSLDAAVDKTIDGAMLKYYDRAAPKATKPADAAQPAPRGLPRVPFLGW